MDKKAVVRSGYNSIVHAYLASRNCGSEDVRLLDDLMGRLPTGAWILDAGCGAGIPVSRILSQSFRVIGVDFAENQVAMARKRVPSALFLCQDMTNLGFKNSSFDAICSYYAIIHIPRSEHEGIINRFHDLLKPLGLALLCLGAEDLEEDVEENYYGARMYWSHFGADDNLRMLKSCGFEIMFTKLVADASFAGSRHLFVLAKKAGDPSSAKK